MKNLNLAAKLLSKVIFKKNSLSAVFEESKELADESVDRPFIQEICYGVLRWYYKLVAIENRLLHKPLKSNQSELQCLLLIGLYQLMYMSVPEYAVVSNTVSAVKSLKKSWAAGLVNKILRRFIREKDSILLEVDKNIVARFAHPQWLIDEIKKAWPQQWEKILEANNKRAPMTLRVNRLKISAADYLQKLSESGISGFVLDKCASSEKNKYPPQAIQLEKSVPVSQLPGFSEGLCSIQDASGQNVAFLLDLTPGQRVLDACAAPGSKTCHILEMEPKLEALFAIDKDPERITKIKENINRLGHKDKNIRLISADASQTQEWWDGELFDRILLDAPCSATGVIRRHPDIKILRRPEDIEQLVQEQRLLINGLWPLLKPTGKLVYSTCSVLPQENQQQINEFLLHHKDARHGEISIKNGLHLKYGHQLLPELNGPDGFYFCILEKVTPESIGDEFQKKFGEKNGIDLKIKRSKPHEPMDFE